jgi:hypothetical protein
MEHWLLKQNPRPMVMVATVATIVTEIGTTTKPEAIVVEMAIPVV